MSLETVVTDIRDEARERAAEIRAEADARVDEIIDDAEADAESIIDEAERDVESQVEQEREQRLSSAKLEAKQKRLETRRDRLNDVYDAVAESLANLETEDREELTSELIAAAATEFEDVDEIDVYARADDEDLVTNILTDYEGFEYAGEYDCLGGVVVESKNSRIRINNTFDSLLESVWENNLKDISVRLFDDEAQ